jgi:hypothetical protein
MSPHPKSHPSQQRLPGLDGLSLMHWATRTFSVDGWYYVQDQFEAEWEASGSPSDMMLVYVQLPDHSMQLFVGLPDAGELLRYRGFDHCPLPPSSSQPKLLMGDLKEHEFLFRRR